MKNPIVINLKKTCLIAGLLTVLLPINAFAKDKVVAKVNGQLITEQDMRHAETEMFNQLGDVPEKVRRKVLVEYLIETKLLAKAAEDAKITETEHFKQREAYFKRRALRDAYFQHKILDTVTLADVKKVYEEESNVQEISVSHILVKPEEEKKANELYDQLKKGGDFAALAKKHSIDPGTKEKGGDLGFIDEARLVPSFVKAARSLKKKGELAKPTKSPFGWHIIRLNDTRKRVLPPLKDIEDRLHAGLRQQKAHKLIGDLRKNAKVEYIDKALEKSLQEARGSN